MLILPAVVASTCVHAVWADTFGSGKNAFEIDFVVIDHPGNPADKTESGDAVGSVGYVYRIGKFEIPEDAIDKANALGYLEITHGRLGSEKPASKINWFEAAKFVNWLNINKGHTPAYKFDSEDHFLL